MRHGSNSGNPHDESTAFALSFSSAHDETTATLPNHHTGAASSNYQEQNRDPPSVIVCQVIDYVDIDVG